MSFKNLVKRLYAPEYLIKPRYWVGEKPPAKNVYSELTRVAWPSITEAVLISLLTFVDTAMVASVGPQAVAAVGITNQPRFIFYALFFALNVGTTVIVSRRFGQEDRSGANKCLEQSLLLSIAASAVLVTLSFFVTRPLLSFSGAGEDIIGDASVYFRITMVGLAFTGVGMTINAAQRGAGNTKISLRTNLTANIVNVIFNYFLINGIWFFPRLEVKGAAIATLLGNIASCIMSIISVSGAGAFLHPRIKNLFKPDPAVFRQLAKVSGSAALEQLFVRIGFFSYVKIVAALGTTAFATHQICMSIINFSYSIGDGLSIAVSALVGQYLGRKRPDLSQVFSKAATRIGLGFSSALFILFAFFGGELMKIFTREAGIVALGAQLLLIVAFASPGQITQLVFSGTLRGAGDTKYVAYMSLISICLIRPVLTYVLCWPLELGLIGAWFSLIVDQYTRLLLTAVRFSKGKWKKIEV